MKQLTIVFTMLISTLSWAQAPEKMSYQAIVRDASGKLLTSQSVGVQISILTTSSTGTEVYVETQTPTTNENGLLNIEIGTGNATTGSFSTIDWAADVYFLKAEIDPDGGSTYTISATSQLMSVPYALHAKTANTASSAQIAQTANTSNSATVADTALYAKSAAKAKHSLEIQDNDDSLAIKDNDGLTMSKIGLEQATGWRKVQTSNSLLSLRNISINSNSSQAKINTYSGGSSLEMQGIANYIETDATHSAFAIGSKNRVRGPGLGVHIGMLGIGGDDVKYNLAGAVRYGMVGMSTDTVSASAYNAGVYGNASNNATANYGVDGTADSDRGDNYGTGGFAYGATTGKNYGLFGYAASGLSENYAVFGQVASADTTKVNYSGYFKGAPVAVEDASVYLKDATKGIILTSPNGTCWLATVSNTGAITTTATTCPN